MKQIKSIYYHDPEPQGFERMVIHYLRRGYVFLSVERLYHILESREDIGRNRYVFVSLDDGWRGNLRLLPVIMKYQIPVCLFVTTSVVATGNFWWEYVREGLDSAAVNKFKTLPYPEFKSRILELEKKFRLERSVLTREEISVFVSNPLVSVQSHSVTHPILTNISDQMLETEMADSSRVLSEWTGKDMLAFSYPNGTVSGREYECCRKYYHMAFTVEQRNIRTDDDMFLLPRYCLTGDFYRDLLKVCGIWKWLKKIWAGNPAVFFRKCHR